MLPSREFSLNLLKQYNEDPYHISHALAVESVMGYFAELNNEDVSKWSLVGLLHDLDYGKYPDQHCIAVVDILKENGYPEDFIYSITSHCYRGISEHFKKPEHIMEKILFTIDELCGLIHAAALMRPSKSVMDMNVKSVKKKFKSKGFAQGVSREIIIEGMEVLGWDLDYTIEYTLKGMQRVHEEIGL